MGDWQDIRPPVPPAIVFHFDARDTRGTCLEVGQLVIITVDGIHIIHEYDVGITDWTYYVTDVMALDRPHYFRATLIRNDISERGEYEPWR